MRYIADDNSYLLQVSFGAMIECNGRGCVEYTGRVPQGYDDLADWFTKEGDKLHRWYIVEGDLTLDPDAPEPEVYVPPEPEPTVSMVMLWENGTPADAFPEQTISLDWASYDQLLIMCAHSSEIVKAELGQTTQVKMIILADNATICGCFRWVEVVDDGVKISTECTATALSSMTQDERLVPLQIYGIKGTSKPTPTDKMAICGTFLSGEVICGT